MIDYGLGNLASVVGALERLQHEAKVSADPRVLGQCDKLVLPGVGAFGDGMRNLRERQLVEPLTRMVAEGKPVLGICLGAQLMTRSSEEFGFHEGLGWIDGQVRRLPSEADLRIPHVGWNALHQRRESPLFTDVPGDALFYYVHSYCISCSDAADVVGECEYGTRFVAAFARGSVCGTQFHPEKSQLAGLTVLRNFLDRH